MDCKEIRDNFSDYFDGILPKADQDLIRGHLRDCEDCGKEYRSYSSAIRMVSNLPEMPAPPGFIFSLRERLDEAGTPWWSRVAASLNDALNVVPLRAMTAAAGVVLLLTVLFVSRHDDSPLVHDLSGFRADETPAVPGMLVSGTHPVPVEFASTNPEPLGFETPTDFLMAVIASDSLLNRYDRYPHHRGDGAIIHTPSRVLEVEMDPADFLIIQAFARPKMPSSLREAKMTYPIYIRSLPSPMTPLEK